MMQGDPFPISERLLTMARRHVTSEHEAQHLAEQAFQILCADPSLICNDNVTASLQNVVERLARQRG
jgi:hypothetical protein